MPLPLSHPRRSREPSRLARLAIVAIAVVGIGATATGAGAATRRPHPGILPPGHPAANIAPVPDFTASCTADTFDDSATCASAVVSATNAARAAEGVGPLHFSLTRFLRESRLVQIFVITNLEREARGLPVFTTLSSHLDQLALVGARADTDPAITGSRARMPGGAQIVAWGANWAGNTYNALASNYFWMYEDGPGAYNLTCPTGGSGSGCWAHRLNILGKYPRAVSNCAGLPIQRSMGAAATVAGSPAQPSLTELFVAACGKPVVGVVETWAKAEHAVGI